MPTGGKLWRMKYRYEGKERIYSIGPYPEVSLTKARAKRDEARDHLRDGRDPTKARNAREEATAVEDEAAAARKRETFRSIGDEWLKKQSFSAGHEESTRVRLDRELYPHLGDTPIRSIEPSHVMHALGVMEKRGALETLAKCRRLGGQIFRYAIATGRASVDPFQPLRDAFKTPDTKNRATVPLDDMPDLLGRIAAVPAELSTKLAFYWTMLTCARTVEMRFATWSEIKGDRWIVPASRMKARREHVVPLSTQTQAVLLRARDVRTGPGGDALLFPGFTRSGWLSENALLALLARAGYFGRQTAHGFRASFSTWAHEVVEANPDHIEACLAHVVPGVRGDYNRASYLRQRAPLLQAWADQLTKWGMRLP